MALQKRLDYGFNGYEAPAVPRATRTTRRRTKFQRRVQDDQMCAIDLLATLAGKFFFQDKGNPTMPSDASTDKDQHGFVEGCQDSDKPLKDELFYKQSFDNNHFPHFSSQTNKQNCPLNELQNHEIDVHLGNASVIISSCSSERLVSEKLVDAKCPNKMKNFTSKDILGSSGHPVVNCCKLDGESKTNKLKDKLHKLEKVSIDLGTKMCGFEDPPTEKPPTRISLGSKAKLSKYVDIFSYSSLPKGCDNVSAVRRDDDENFSGSTHPCTKTKSFMPVTGIHGRRLRKLLSCKYSKIAQELKNDTLASSDETLKPTYSSKKNYYKRQRSQMNIPFKKRKQFHCSSVSNSSGFIRSADIYYSPESDCGIPVLESPLGCRRGDPVNIRIKSFTVPELFIEIPETATVGSLKRTVMDAVTTVLGGGLHVGVVLQGKKVRDDSKTLLQAGISHDNQLDALGFTLEPNVSQRLPPLHASTSHSLIRYPSNPAVTHQRTRGISDMLIDHQVTSLGNHVESEHDSAPSLINKAKEKSTVDSKPLISFPEMSKDEKVMIPVVQKSKPSEILQRRIRRPFSVDEVEALIQSVEKLGTGRWRDVKCHAFGNVDHRTYVDLKDKWKTLVHTAGISPRQRRGEPVPQDLLDRVLKAQAYWSQHQTKQHHKTNLLDQGLPIGPGYVHGITA
ncbi:telomere repeat-binding protein 2 [Arachis duranensis]|uniref:Telomere repeat-binding protein 2 n=1 Tax=Arachis duranensis TaxID=130453 RepID=A0A6P4CIU2_ARADU|nr:telomere repeat-binding protein 2 [Arachis duranensis]